jgi:peptidoglycan-N-acetylglucosamine deacetylase
MTLYLRSNKAIVFLKRALAFAIGQFIGTITHVSTREPLVALTFDDGPHPDYTPRLLEILARHQAHATFFMIGETATRHPEIVTMVARQGHAIGNHSWDHPSFPLINGRERRKQIRACAKAISPYGVPLFRPPYCDQTLASWFDAFLLGYRVIAYNVTTDDWCGGDADAVAGQIERRARPGSVIVLHERLFDAMEESYFNRESLLKALDISLDRLAERFRFVTLPELLRHGTPRKTFWRKQTEIELLNKLRTPAGAGRRYFITPS